ncbi:MAG: FAD-dependent oxidoreductase [Dehalococcoidales bacterium]|nr:FAD-dependent oxidoreductase [Dehalococcoidales bacterium]
MSICKYSHLFSPIRLGNSVFKNRYFAAPVGYEYLSSRNYPLDETIAFFERKAMGGAATVNIGSGAPDSKRGIIGLSNLYLDDPTALPPIYRLATAITRHGAIAVIELGHSGANSYMAARRGNQIYGVVDGLNALGNFVPAMPESVIEETIEAFADGAAFAKFCGFGMITIHAGHGTLLNQFLDPNINNRKDRWGGGSMENRARFPLAIIERIKKKCGRGFPIDIRISGAMCYEGGYDIDVGIQIAQQFDGKVELIHVSAGCHEAPEAFTITHPSMFLPDGVNVRYAAEIKKHVQTPVSTVGAIADPEIMEEIIASGQADVIMAARAMMADPDAPKKARAGKADEIRPCLRCYECFTGITTRRQYRCAVNPEIGFEQEARHALPAIVKKNVLVAGGGVAGMQAALTASQRGHKVVLYEKSDRLGGTLRCEEKVPFKKHLMEYLDCQARMISRSSIEVLLNTPLTPNLAKAADADVIIAALGAHPLVPMIRGIDRRNVLSAEEAYYHPEKAARDVVILGGGLTGIELSIFLLDLGRQVTILEMMPTLNDGGNSVHGLALINEIKKRNLKASTSTLALEINEQGVIGEYVGDVYAVPPCPTIQAATLESNTFGRVFRNEAEQGSKKLFPGDTVIYAIGRQPLFNEADALRFCAPEFHQIGDCLAPKNILQATSTAYTIARDI